MPEFKSGDRVYVTDPALAQLREIMCRYGEDPAPNHHGTVIEVYEDAVLISFDSAEGEGMGNAAPYSLHEVRHLIESGEPTPDSEEAS